METEGEERRAGEKLPSLLAVGAGMVAIGAVLTVFVFTAIIGVPLAVVGASIIAYALVDRAVLHGRYKTHALAVLLAVYGALALWANLTILGGVLVVLALLAGVAAVYGGLPGVEVVDPE